ncbi:tRNA dihydrouridine synthase DusB [Thiocystis violacea]|uniref:tRNA dihydrouridine synthase DusB n=1 Tax=Thiocystis violacea TaxID=13725 RepID=UPI0019050CDA|nr:tRNA dihydrouridine synthase DusB [Thiocystis violacea]MBK1723353.1 tRNA dihydrouridine synthase DusB [Thiocystis violacea]
MNQRHRHDGRRSDEAPALSAGLIRPFSIGPYRLANNLVLAPMAGVTDRPYRAICRELGAGLAVAEMVSANTTLWNTRKSIRRLDYAGETGPVAAQILGTDPAAMAAAARINVDLGAHIIDINMGCPAKKVCKVAAGSALLRDERLVGRILEAVVSAVDAPVTLKIRTGWAPESRNAVQIARIARESGIAALTVHGRTRACTYGTPAEHETLRRIKDEVEIPLIANGDIDSPEQARRVLDYTGADAIMIGRAAQGRPWIFHEIARALDPADPARPLAHAGGRVPPRDWIKNILRTHLEALYAFYGDRDGVRIARKHIGWYCRELRDAASFRQAINRTEHPADQLSQVLAFLDQSPEMETEAA